MLRFRHIVQPRNLVNLGMSVLAPAQKALTQLSHTSSQPGRVCVEGKTRAQAVTPGLLAFGASKETFALDLVSF